MSTDPTAGTTGQAAPDLDAIEEKWLRQCAAHDAGMAMSCTCPEGDPRNVIDALVTEVRTLRRAATYDVEREHLQWLAKCLGETQEVLNVPGRLPALAPADVPARVRALLAENARLRQERNEYRDGQQRALKDREAVEAEMDRRLDEARDALEAETAKRKRLGMALSHLRTDMSILADRVRDAVATSSPLSATETAPQTVPGVTGHTEPSTAPSAPAGGHWHVGRSWSGTDLEDTCPCPKEPCGLVDLTRAVPECTEHPAARAKSMRQVHAASECPGNPPPSGEGAALIADTEKETSAMWLSSGVPDLAAVTDMRGAWRETAQTLARKVDERDTLEREWARLVDGLRKRGELDHVTGLAEAVTVTLDALDHAKAERDKARADARQHSTDTREAADVIRTILKPKHNESIGDAAVRLAREHEEAQQQRDEARAKLAKAEKQLDDLDEFVDALAGARSALDWAANHISLAHECLKGLSVGDLAAPSATETAPQTPPGVTGHTEAPTERDTLAREWRADMEQYQAELHWLNRTVRLLWDATGIDPSKEPEFVADAIRGMLDNSRLLRTQIRPQLARAEADAAEARRELAEARAETDRVRHVYREHHNRLRFGVERIAAEWHELARGLADDSELGTVYRGGAAGLRILLDETRIAQPAASDAQSGSNGCDCDPLTGCPAGGHDA